MKKHLIMASIVFLLVAVLFGFNFISKSIKNHKVISSELVYLTTSDYQNYYLNSLDNDKKIKLVGTGYDSIYRSANDKEIILSNNYGFVVYNKLGFAKEYYPKGQAIEETREDENNVVAPSSLSEGMFTNSKEEEYIYTFYNNEYLDEEDATTGPVFRIFNTNSKVIDGIDIKGEVYSSYYDKAKNAIFYLAESNTGHNDFYAAKIDLNDKIKAEKLYDIDIFDKENPLSGAIIPTEKGIVCISCDKKNKLIDEYQLKSGKLKKVNTIKQEEATEISTNFRHLEEELFFDESEDIHTYNLSNNNLSKYETKGRSYNQAFTFENKKIYYLKANTIYEIDQYANESELISLPVNGTQEIVAFSLSSKFKQ